MVEYLVWNNMRYLGRRRVLRKKCVFQRVCSVWPVLISVTRHKDRDLLIFEGTLPVGIFSKEQAGVMLQPSVGVMLHPKTFSTFFVFFVFLFFFFWQFRGLTRMKLHAESAAVAVKIRASVLRCGDSA
jgi:hypothetical protein